MNLLTFISHYPDEGSRHRQFKAYHDWDQYDCSGCGARQTSRSNTAMHSSTPPFRYWFIAAPLQTSTHKSFSALEVQRQLGHKHYEPIWTMLHKLRTIEDRISKYSLQGPIELDYGFFSVRWRTPTETSHLRGAMAANERPRCWRWSKANQRTGRTKMGEEREVAYLAMMAVDSLQRVTLSRTWPIGSHTIDPDGSTSDSRLEKLVPKKEAGEILPWCIFTTSNAKRLFLNSQHSIKRENLQNYLNKFYYKFNQKHFNITLFERLPPVKQL